MGVPKATVKSSAGGGAASPALTGQVNALENQLSELKLQNDTLEKERQFYFDKLRELEMLLQVRSATDGLGGDILKILYASEDEKVAIDEGGTLTI